jgi:hypothetical protein
LFVLYNDENYKSEIDSNPLEIPEGFPKLKFGISLCSYHSSFEEDKVKKYVDKASEEYFEMLGQHFMMAPLGKKCHTFYGDDYLKYALTAFVEKIKSLAIGAAYSALTIEKLNQYLLQSQDEKIYILYKNGEFHLQLSNPDDYIIQTYEKQSNRYVAITKSDKKIKILLRWKNGNGIAYPAFQIS